jgi:hypothetical protein
MCVDGLHTPTQFACGYLCLNFYHVEIFEVCTTEKFVGRSICLDRIFKWLLNVCLIFFTSYRSCIYITTL